MMTSILPANPRQSHPVSHLLCLERMPSTSAANRFPAKFFRMLQDASSCPLARGTHIYWWFMTTTATPSLPSLCRPVRACSIRKHILECTPSSPNGASSHNLRNSTMKPPAISKIFSRQSRWISSWCRHMSIVVMLQSALSAPSRITSSLASAVLTPIFHYTFGTDSSRKPSSHSTCFVVHASTHSFQHMLRSMVPLTSTALQLARRALVC